ncbi:hypothetical protein Csa_003156 [Cucumis sativus]|uniref:Uncharacterized protein n=1 Tax=Cucumis sativus TaxID=3659 RepID=A0A0A0KHE5_CUCSA|nr:hypothetical protein Csa_003156 [Cucumis sativus]
MATAQVNGSGVLPFCHTLWPFRLLPSSKGAWRIAIYISETEYFSVCGSGNVALQVKRIWRLCKGRLSFTVNWWEADMKVASPERRENVMRNEVFPVYGGQFPMSDN